MPSLGGELLATPGRNPSRAEESSQSSVSVVVSWVAFGSRKQRPSVVSELC